MTDIEADGVGSGCNFDVRASVRSSHRVEGVIGDINDEGEISGPWIVSRTLKLMATFRDIRITERVRFWVLCDGTCKMLEHGYETLGLRKELGSGSYVTDVQDVGTRLWASVRSSHRVEGVIGDINDEGEISGPWIVSRTLKLMATFRDIRITERVRFWVLCDGECKMLEHGYETLGLRKELGSGSYVTGVQDVGTRLWASVRSSHRVEGVIGDINDEGEISGPWIVSRTLKLMATFRDIRITERVRFWVLCDGECKMLEHGYGECAIQFQDYSEAIVVSMVILEFQATGPR
ncbi:Coagulation Factor Viii [Manis pentadactyla]|nr:Coagulation Factor Viii [Manis pentadactyla]